MALGAILGAAGSIISGMAQSDAAEDAARGAQFRPFNVSGPGGDVSFEGQNITLTPGDREAGIRAGLLSEAEATLGATSADAAAIRQLGLGAVPGTFNELMAAPNLITPAALDAAGRFQQQANLAQTLGTAGVTAGLSGPSAAGLTQFATGTASGLLNQAGPASFNQLSAERLSQLRAQARPLEERAVNSRLTNLFNTGRLGTRGGAQAIGDLAQRQEADDIARQVAAGDFAAAQLQRDRDFMTTQQTIGANILGSAFGGIGLDQRAAANQGNLGATLFNQFGQGQGASLEAIGAADTAGFNRAQNRLAASEQLFGFGQGVQDASLATTLTALGGTQAMDQQLLDRARLGASVGQAQASAGANAGLFTTRGASSPLGGALAGFGTGLQNSDFSFNNPFRGFGGGGNAGAMDLQTSTQLGTGNDFFKPDLGF